MRAGLALICQFVRSSSSRHKPWQVALAITVGLLLGIIPKTTALFAMLCLVSFLAPIHLPILVLFAIATSCVAPLLETPLAHLGYWSLTHPKLVAFWFRIDTLPFAPWMGIHNTVVHGSLVLWSCLAAPVFVCSLVVSRMTLVDGIAAEADRIADSFQLLRTKAPALEYSVAQELRPIAGTLQPGPAASTTAPPIVVWDDIHYQSPSEITAPMPLNFSRSEAFSSNLSEEESYDTPPTTDEVIQRAADLAVWAEELIRDELLEDSKTNRVTTHAQTGQGTTAGTGDEEEQWLIETTMEVVRIAEQAVANQAAMKAKQAEESIDNTKVIEKSETQLSKSTEDSTLNAPNVSGVFESAFGQRTNVESVTTDSTIRREQSPHTEHHSHLDASRSTNATGVNRPREEALHYLLRHLKGVQEKAQKQ